MTIWRSQLHQRLSRAIRRGGVDVVYPDGSEKRYGEACAAPLKVRIHNRAWLRRLILDPELAFGEAYMEGGLVIERGDLFTLLDLVWSDILSTGAAPGPALPAFARRALRRLSQFNPARRAQKNAAHHYDLGNDFYRLFLDKDLQYSCAYFERPDYTLEEAQAAKKRLIARKLLIEPDQSVLEIGCGWGGLGVFIAEETGACVDGVTLACEQLRIARERAGENGLSERALFRLEDYRAIEGRYDRVVSVGMFEHVGLPHFDDYFGQIARLMEEDGVALVHTIGRPDGAGVTNPWIARHIFPGGYIPALSEIIPAVERAGLVVADIEVWRLHYAETLKEWRRRFLDNADKIEKMYDARFVRMWEFYLVSSELSFRYGAHVVFQLQLARRQDAVPLTRRYLFEDRVQQSLRNTDRTRICA